MRGKRLRQIRRLFHRGSPEFIFEPVTHRLNPHPVLTKSMMSAIAPAYEEALSKEEGDNSADEPQR